MGRSLELFTGAGGLALASHLSGFHHAGLFEWNQDACDTLRENSKARALSGIGTWASRLVQGNVETVDFRRYEGVDLVAGGPPCQPFSLGGLHAGREDRRDMIPQFIRSIREARPRAFVMENVRGLARKSFATYLEYTKLQLAYPHLIRKPKEGWDRHFRRLQQRHTSIADNGDELTYNVLFSDVRNAADYGVPQCRDRIFLVGFRSDVDAHWSFPEPTHSAAALLYEKWVTGEYWQRLGLSRPQMPNGLSSNKIKSEGCKPWVTLREAIRDLPEPFPAQDDKDGIQNHRLQKGARPYPGHTGSPLDHPAKALKAGGHGVPGGENMIAFDDGSYRYLTVRESARVQTFPDTWHFRGAWSEAMRQLGNAVPVRLAKVVTDSVASKLRLKRIS